jgi:signal transduction histidine kinase
VDVEVMAARGLNGSPSVTIDITDTGMGIPADDIPHVFERFFRATNAQVQAVQGTGLGLAIVREIVRAHRGDVSVSSVLGEGTALRIELPARQSAPVQDRSKVPSMPSRENYPDQLYSRGDGGI